MHHHPVYHRAAALAPLIGLLAVIGLTGLIVPARAWAHGAVNPEASVDEARITHVPSGIRVRMVDGDLRLWMWVPRELRVTVVDYQGGAYLRWTPQGVQANESSPMFYLNLSPPIIPSLGLTRSTAPTWHGMTSGRSYLWHDGRIAALADSLSAPDARVLGRWSIPLIIDGHAASIGGVLDHRPRPSLAWLWPAAAIVLVLPALLRLRDARAERRVGRIAGALTALATVVLSIAAGLHGRPGLSIVLLVSMAVELALVGWAAWRLLGGRVTALPIAVIATVALYRAISGISVLWRGYVLLALPALVGRIAVSMCLAGGICLAVGLIVIVARDTPDRRPARTRRAEA